LITLERQTRNLCPRILCLSTSWVMNRLLKQWMNNTIWLVFHMLTLSVLLCMQ